MLSVFVGVSLSCLELQERTLGNILFNYLLAYENGWNSVLTASAPILPILAKSELFEIFTRKVLTIDQDYKTFSRITKLCLQICMLLNLQL